MLIQVFLTDGYYGYTEILIKSFKHFHGEDMPMVATTRNLTDKQILKLERLYKNIIVLNEQIDMKKLSERTGHTIKQLLKYKSDVENYKISPGHSNIVWKQFIAVESRYRNSIVESFDYARDEKHMINIDADSIIKKPLDPIFEVVENNDVSFIFRLDRKQDIRKIYGTLSGYRIGEKSRRFLKRWRHYIDKIPLKNKPQGYGQSSCYYAWKDLKNSNIKFGVINKKWVHAYDITEDLLIRTGNHGRGKSKTLKIFEKELEKING